MNDAMSEFMMTTASLDDVSVGIENDGETIVVSCRDHDGRDEIDTEDIHEAVKTHGLHVENTIGDFGAGELRLRVVER